MRRHLEKLTALLGPLLLHLRRKRGPTPDELWREGLILAEEERAKIVRRWPTMTTAQQEVAYYRIKDTFIVENVWQMLEDSGIDVGERGYSG
jgi:hypothetical protein